MHRQDGTKNEVGVIFDIKFRFQSSIFKFSNILLVFLFGLHTHTPKTVMGILREKNTFRLSNKRNVLKIYLVIAEPLENNVDMTLQFSSLAGWLSEKALCILQSAPAKHPQVV